MIKPINDETRIIQLQSHTDSLHPIFIVLIDLLTPNTWQRNINYHKQKINCFMVTIIYFAIQQITFTMSVFKRPIYIFEVRFF